MVDGSSDGLIWFHMIQTHKRLKGRLILMGRYKTWAHFRGKPPLKAATRRLIDDNENSTLVRYGSVCGGMLRVAERSLV